MFAIAAASGWVPERKAMFEFEKIRKNSRLVVLSLTITSAAVICGIVLMDATIVMQVTMTVILSQLVFTIAYFTLPRTIFMCNLYLFFIEAFTVNFVGATDYFYTSRHCKGIPISTQPFATFLLAGLTGYHQLQ